jgi:dTDP-4-amino-4,6-dideoxygalactose transaminase
MIPLHKVFMPKNISYRIENILNSGKLSFGNNTKKFEDELKLFIENDKILSISGNSVFFALKLLDIKENDEVIASPMSCLMSTQPIVYSGAKVRWADIDPLTGTLCPDDIKRKINSKTKAIIHYHWAGYPGYIDEINEIACKNGITVIEDASEAFGAEYKNSKIGNTNTDIVCFSFTPVRLPNAIDGGGLSFKNTSLFEKAKLVRDLGIDRNLFRDEKGEISDKCDICLPGLSFTMNDLSGHVGYEQMKFLKNLLSHQRENAHKWKVHFEKDNNVKLVGLKKIIKPSYWVFSILSDKIDAFIDEYRDQGFYASKLHTRNDIYSVFGSNCSELKGVDYFSKRQVSIPCGWWMNGVDRL